MCLTFTKYIMYDYNRLCGIAQVYFLYVLQSGHVGKIAFTIKKNVSGHFLFSRNAWLLEANFMMNTRWPNRNEMFSNIRQKCSDAIQCEVHDTECISLLRFQVTRSWRHARPRTVRRSPVLICPHPLLFNYLMIASISLPWSLIIDLFLKVFFVTRRQ